MCNLPEKPWPIALFLATITLLVNATAEELIDFNIEAGDARKTIREFAAQSNQSILYDYNNLEGIQTNQVIGSYAPKEAISKLLEGTPLLFDYDVETGAFAVIRQNNSHEEFSPDQTSANLDDPTNAIPKQQVNENMKTENSILGKLLTGLAGLIVATSTPQAIAQDDADEDEVFLLSPFEVSAGDNIGYSATHTLAGTRLRAELKDLGSAISVYNREFMEDLAAVDNESLLNYTVGAEVGGVQSSFAGVGDGASVDERGNFNNPNSNTRIRGLNRADNTMNFFLTDVPWDSYNVDRVDMQRGPNSILFGLGSPAGIINANTQDAFFGDTGNAEVRIGSFGTSRGSININRSILEDELAVRLAGLADNRKFEQGPARDDRRRIYFATKYAPEFLNNDTTTLIINANVESGYVRSNRPRVLTPQDRITPFLRPSRNSDGSFALLPGLNGELFDPLLVRRREQDAIGLGQMNQRIVVDGVEIENPNYNPAIGNYAQLFGGPLFMWEDPNSSNFNAQITEINQRGGLAPDGSIDDNLATGFSRWTAPQNYITYAQDANLPFANFGQYKQFHLQDSSIFNFYDQLIDGPNKEEWSNWDVMTLTLANTFFKNNLGYEIAYFEQNYDDGRVGITGFNDAIYVDTNSHLADGSVNPNAGRPFISDSVQGGNQIRDIYRDSFRATAFGRLKFNEIFDGWLGRILGVQTINGVYSEQYAREDRRTFHRYGMEEAFYDVTGIIDGQDNINIVNTTHYLGDTLLGRSSASGANLSNLNAVQLPSSTSVYFFDTTWNAPDVDPGAPWDGNSTQSENPANYVGWTNRDFTVIDSMQGDNYNQLISNASLASSFVESNAFVWHGQLLDHAIVGTYGWREDTVETLQTNAPEIRSLVGGTQRFRDVSPEVYNLDFEPTIEKGESESWSVGVHVDRLPFFQFLPFELSLYYNEGNNFQPGAGRVDLFGREIAAPSGMTVDQSILIGTKDGRYSLKITDFETSVNNATAGRIQGDWFIGRFVAWGNNWANIFKHNISRGFTLDGVAQEGDNRTWRYEMRDPNGSINPEYEAAAIADWEEFIAAINSQFPDYVSAWQLDGLGTEVRNFSSQAPAGLNYVENTISKGQEYEFIARPTNNWRIAINASRTEAIRNDVGGEALIQWVEFVDSYINNPDSLAGDIRIWSGNGNSIRNMWNSTFRSNYALTELLEGTSTPEMREWRFNAITNYRFSEGKLRGLSVGGALRWEDDVVIGYPIATDSEGVTTFDLSSPYKGPSNTKIDLTFGYRREVMDGINWRIQLNLRNIFADDDLIPINVQPDGSPAAVRIPEPMTWTLTNTFEF